MGFLLVCLVLGSFLSDQVLCSRSWCGKNETYKAPAGGTCRGYWHCNQGILSFDRCSYLKTFDSEKLECIWNPLSSSSVPCGQQNGFNGSDLWCSVGKTYRAPVSGLCDSYFDCQNGAINIEKCTWPTAFNPQERECQLNVWPNQFSCWNGDNDRPSSTPGPDLTSTTAPCKSTTPDVSLCVKGRTFVSEDLEDCTKYLVCDDGVEQTNTCGYYKKFDPVRLECRYDTYWDPVNCRGAVVSSTPRPTTMLPVTTLGPVTTSPAPITSSLAPPPTYNVTSPSCVNSNYFTYPYPGDCQKYYLCSNGKLQVKQCSTMYRFDSATHQCQFNLPWFDSVNCSDKTDKPVCKSGYYFKTSLQGSTKKYFDCSDGDLELKECGLLQTFYESTQSCQYNVFGYSLETKNRAVIASLNGTNCIENSSFNFTYPGDCHKYYSCFNGTSTSYECPYGKKFSSKSSKCEAMTHCDLLKCHEKGPLCYPGITYRVADTSNCERYSECKDGYWFVKSCPWRHRFDPQTQRCLFALFKNIDCSAQVKCDNKPILESSMTNSSLQRVGRQHENLELKSSGKPKCETGQTYKVSFPYDCAKYYDCSGGNLTVKKCSMFDKFDPKILDCRFSSPFNPVVCASIPGRPSCQKGQTFKAVFPYDCSKYYQCNSGKLSVQECSILHKFDPKILQCRMSFPFHSVNCNSPPGEPTCSGGQKFKSVYPGQCNRYYLCSNGSVSEEECLFWQLFDPATLECRLNVPFVDSVNCSAVPGSGLKPSVKRTVRVRDATRMKINRTVEVASVMVTSKPTGPVCASNQNYYAVYPEDCQHYYRCKDGEEIIEKCSWFKKFNPATLKCRWDLPLYRVNCSDVPGRELPDFPINVRENCTPGKSFKSVDRSDCKAYFSCSDGNLSYETCGLMKKFDPVTLSCSVDLPLHRVNCSALPGEPTCAAQGIIRKPYPGNCSKYYECNNGRLNVVYCGALQKFDHKKLECRLDLPFFSVDCGDKY